MDESLTTEAVIDPDDAPRSAPWRPLTRVTFRFVVVYFALFCLWFAQITYVFVGIFGLWLPQGAILWQMRMTDPLTSWVGRQVFGVDAALHLDSGSGDQAAIWVGLFCLLVVAVTGTLVWSLADRRRTEYTRLSAWFTVFLRLCLGGQMLFYGFAKLIPTQMPAPPLSALLQPFGEFSPASVLWLQVGSSYPYEMALGAVEVAAGVLLFWPRTATLGALLSLLSTAQIFLLNMTFDVPVKILSFHLLLISAVLVAPHLRRLLNAVVLERPSEPVLSTRLFRDRRANRIATVMQVVLGVWVLIGQVASGWQSWNEYGGGRAQSELYGLWAVTEFSADGRPAPPLTTDQNRWNKVVFDEPGVLTFQQMDGQLRSAPADIDAAAGTIAVTQPLPPSDGKTAPTPDPAPFAAFSFDRSSPDELRLTGDIEGRPVAMQLERIDPATLPLNSRGFHWVQEYPYFR